jgi:hypothetical protein
LAKLATLSGPSLQKTLRIASGFAFFGVSSGQGANRYSECDRDVGFDMDHSQEQKVETNSPQEHDGKHRGPGQPIPFEGDPYSSHDVPKHGTRASTALTVTKSQIRGMLRA